LPCPVSTMTAAVLPTLPLPSEYNDTLSAARHHRTLRVIYCWTLLHLYKRISNFLHWNSNRNN